MAVELLEFVDYKKFLHEKLDELDGGGRGARARLSRAIGCQTAYTAQVLGGDANFSLEQAESINDFLGHTEEQGHYFLLLVQLARAGSAALQARIRKQVDSLREKRSLLKNRLGLSGGLAEQDQALYYSSWIYGAIHAFVSVPGFQTPEKIAQRLHLDVKVAASAIEFLVRSGLVERAKGGLKVGRGQIHLGADSPLITKHHINWRLQAMRNLERSLTDGLHYSSVVSVSRKDADHIREILVDTIKKIKPVIRDSPEEDVACLLVDFFRL